MLEELFADFATIYAPECQVDNDHTDCVNFCNEISTHRINIFHYQLLQSYLDFVIENKDCTKSEIYEFLKSMAPV